MRQKTQILLTCFEAFGKRKVNSSYSLLMAFDRARMESLFDCHIERSVLPVDWELAPKKITQLCATLRPKTIICFGEANRSLISIESRARNLRSTEVMDNADKMPPSPFCRQWGQEFLASTLPISKLLEAFQGLETPIPVLYEESQSAGTFLCNNVFYETLFNENQKNISEKNAIGFIHIPVDFESHFGCRDHFNQYVEKFFEVLLLVSLKKQVHKIENESAC